MSNYGVITLQDASFFSTLAYAPVNMDAIAWGKTNSANLTSNVNSLAAAVLGSSGWQDETQTIIDQYKITTGQNARFFDSYSSNGNPHNEFRIFVNGSQVVFAFKDSTGNPNNWLSDLVTSDQGFSQYSAIQGAANALLSFMKGLSSAYSSDQSFSDGHSLGGGMAQTFALQNNISGFGQNSLSISPTSESQFFPQGFANAVAGYVSRGATFQELNLQGDIASTVYHTHFFQEDITSTHP